VVRRGSAATLDERAPQLLRERRVEQVVTGKGPSVEHIDLMTLPSEFHRDREPGGTSSYDSDTGH
jgi:hypothetical protein